MPAVRHSDLIPASKDVMPAVPRRLHDLPPFDDRTIALVRESCARLPEKADVLTRVFYTRLFEMAPAVRPMFPAEMRPQEERLLNALLAAVAALDDPAKLEPQLRAWGAWHRRALGVTDDMYVYVGHALIRALRSVLGHTETSVGSAWVAVYEWLAAVMIDGADAAERPQYPVSDRPMHLQARFPPVSAPGAVSPVRGGSRRG